MNALKIFNHDTEEYNRLAKVADALTAISEHGTSYKVKDVYFDLGQNWMYTTIIAYPVNSGNYQALSPREQEDALTADTILNAVLAVVNGHSWNAYCVDTR